MQSHNDFFTHKIRVELDTVGCPELSFRLVDNGRVTLSDAFDAVTIEVPERGGAPDLLQRLPVV